MIFFTICAAANSSAMTEAIDPTKILNIGDHNGFLNAVETFLRLSQSRLTGVQAFLTDLPANSINTLAMRSNGAPARLQTTTSLSMTNSLRKSSVSATGKAGGLPFAFLYSCVPPTRKKRTRQPGRFLWTHNTTCFAAAVCQRDLSYLSG